MNNRFLSTGSAKKRPVGRSVWNIFFSNSIFFYKLECMGGGGGGKKKSFLKIQKTKSGRLFLAHSGGGQETILYLRVAPPQILPASAYC